MKWNIRDLSISYFWLATDIYMCTIWMNMCRTSIWMSNSPIRFMECQKYDFSHMLCQLSIIIERNFWYPYKRQDLIYLMVVYMWSLDFVDLRPSCYTLSQNKKKNPCIWCCLRPITSLRNSWNDGNKWSIGHSNIEPTICMYWNPASITNESCYFI